MVASKAVFVLFAAAAAVSARVVPRKTPPEGWWVEGLEDYDTYHTRYLAIGCQNQHGTAFFDACCHPLKKNETLETARAPECIPSASASASSGLTSSTVSASFSETAVSTASATASGSASPSPVSNVATGDDSDDDTCDSEDDDDEDEGDDDDGDDCEDDGDDEDSSTALVPSSTQAPESSSRVAAFIPSSTDTPATTSTPASIPSSIDTPATTSTPAPTSSVHTFSPSSTATPTSSHKSRSSSVASSTTSSTDAQSTDSSSQVFTGGVTTFFYQNGVAGACGTVHQDSDLIAAMDQARYGDSGGASSLCGKQVKITNTDNGKTVTVTVADDCPTCDNENSIDLSTGAFNQIADEATGEVPITWQFV